MKTVHYSLGALALAGATFVFAQTPSTRTEAVRPPIVEAPAAAVTPGNSPSSNSGVAATPLPAPSVDGLAIVANRLYLIRDGQATLQDRTLTMTISAQGFVGFDGRAIPIPQGQMVSMSGQMIPIPANVPGLPLSAPAGGSAGTTPGGGAPTNAPAR